MKELICIVCPKGCRLHVNEDLPVTVTGNQCKRGESYGIAEVTNPVRTVTSTVKVIHSKIKRCPVKTNEPIPKQLIFAVMNELNNIEVTPPISCGHIIVKNICGTSAHLTATKTITE